MVTKLSDSPWWIVQGTAASCALLLLHPASIWDLRPDSTTSQPSLSVPIPWKLKRCPHTLARYCGMPDNVATAQTELRWRADRRPAALMELPRGEKHKVIWLCCCSDYWHSSGKHLSNVNLYENNLVVSYFYGIFLWSKYKEEWNS